MCFSQVLSQDSIPTKGAFSDDIELRFQDYFFKALSDKSIGNHLRAVSNLEVCNELMPNKVAVLFEFSKNYLQLDNLQLAKQYIYKAIEIEPQNLWIRKHLVAVLEKENNLEEAIEVQKEISKNHPIEREKLVSLYVYNRMYEEAVDLMSTLEKENALPASLRKFKDKLVLNKKRRKPKNLKTEEELINDFNENKSYESLQKILVLFNNNPKMLIKYSEQGLRLFPAQSFVYLMNGKALNDTKNFKKALSVLQTGIDFVIDDQTEKRFFKEIARSYKEQGNEKEAKKYLLKIK